LKQKICSSTLKTALVYYIAGVVNSEAVGLASGSNPTIKSYNATHSMERFSNEKYFFNTFKTLKPATTLAL
jgi:hypothetical protein